MDIRLVYLLYNIVSLNFIPYLFIKYLKSVCFVGLMHVLRDLNFLINLKYVPEIYDFVCSVDFVNNLAILLILFDVLEFVLTHHNKAKLRGWLYTNGKFSGFECVVRFWSKYDKTRDNFLLLKNRINWILPNQTYFEGYDGTVDVVNRKSPHGFKKYKNTRYYYSISSQSLSTNLHSRGGFMCSPNAGLSLEKGIFSLSIKPSAYSMGGFGMGFGMGNSYLKSTTYYIPVLGIICRFFSMFESVDESSLYDSMHNIHSCYCNTIKGMTVSAKGFFEDIVKHENSKDIFKTSKDMTVFENKPTSEESSEFKNTEYEELDIDNIVLDLVSDLTSIESPIKSKLDLLTVLDTYKERVQ